MTSKQYDSRTADKFVVRLPDGLRSAIEAAAQADDRSMNSVFVKATRQYLDSQHQQQILLNALAKTVTTPIRPSPASITPPAIGDYWPGQGGIYGGLRHYPEGLCHIIFASIDVGRHAYGEYGTDVQATSNIDGLANTAILVNRDGSHPAAEAAYAYICDGHNDFYLPSSGELHHGYFYLPEAFAKDWYISSTQRSAHTAYFMDFEDGWLDLSGKYNERLARPVRRILQ
ncbi:Arc family DNA-binding protein [Pseudomonas sp. CHM02]|uniref:Arc family DNA-binding protein n=1 Tax=Pseudomonas sp. CHM02 TaxID=1463662 RepID=UPI0009DD1DD8|nr:Arc family DNA-binding protein [Pseudomonas sp. CHM02]